MIRIRQKKVHYYDVINADEIFITSSIAEIMPVKKIDRFIPNKKVPGSITLRLMKLYKGRVSYSKE